MDRVNFLLNTMEMIPQADVLASLRLFAREVMPAFRDAKAVNGGPRAGALMPLVRRARARPRISARLATLRDLDTEPWALPRREILQLAFEVPRVTHALLPRAMHPAIPPYVTFT